MGIALRCNQMKPPPNLSRARIDATSGVAARGHARTWAEHDAVLGAAWTAKGVIDVHDELQVTG